MFQNRILIELLGWGKVLFFSLTIFIFISIFLFQPYIVNGSSMEPTFVGTEPNNNEKTGDYIIVSKSSYKLNRKPKSGDIVVIDSRIYKPRNFKDELLEHPFLSIFATESNGNYKWVKRVIGEEGDTIEIRDGKVFRNKLELEEAYLQEEMLGSYEEITVPDNHVFVLGDNRNHSGDSRAIGPVPNENVIGKVMVRYYPFNKVNVY
ncbi:signal peptidase I [Anaerobacillus isosaccharinicus]|uniref:Signal peptidase I n=1 Tax=Anaerobacillus isosaccharinicus TaxID=1532552 RepID=A0A7S7RE44_9BACI|nr:signal peptidase I [Anaerobacillus isosaccharinicus]